MSNDEQQKLRALILLGLGQVPEVGKLLSALTGIFWKPSENLWDEIKAEVEALIEQDLAKYDEKQVQDDLDGLKNVLDDYQQACTDGDVTTIRTQWEICKDLFDEQLPHFQTSDYQLQLLLLFVQYANLYFSLLRDGVLFGAAWGKNPSEVYTILTTLRTSIGTFQNYTAGVVSTAVANKLAATESDKHAVEPLRTVNAYTRLLTFNALDVAALWRYFVPDAIPSNPPFMRYVYSDPVGTSDDSGSDLTIIPPPASGQPITGVRIWADSGAVYATQLQYAGSVLGPVYGFNDRGAADLPPHGGSFQVSPQNPITGVLVAAGDHIQGLQFQFKDNSLSQVFGNGSGLSALDNYGEMVGDVYVASSSDFYNLSAACLIVGYIPMAS
jgi:hypothetical protein